MICCSGDALVDSTTKHTSYSHDSIVVIKNEFFSKTQVHRGVWNWRLFIFESRSRHKPNDKEMNRNTEILVKMTG